MQLAAAAEASGVNDLTAAAAEYKAHAVQGAAREISAKDPGARCALVLAQLEARQAMQQHAGPLSSDLGAKAAVASVVAAGVDKAALQKLEKEQQCTIKANPHMKNWPDSSPAYTSAVQRLREFKVTEAQSKVGRSALQLRWLENESRAGYIDVRSQDYKSKRCKLVGAVQNALNEMYVWSSFRSNQPVEKYSDADVKAIYKGVMPWDKAGRQHATRVDVLYFGKRALPLLEERNRTFEEARLLKAEAIRCLGYLEQQVSCLEAAAARAPLDSGLFFVLRVHLLGAQKQLSQAEQHFDGWGSPPPVVQLADIPCRKCGKVENDGPNRIMFCEGCDGCGMHVKCAKLDKVPKGAWFCPDCKGADQSAGGERGGSKRKAGAA